MTTPARLRRRTAALLGALLAAALVPLVSSAPQAAGAQARVQTQHVVVDWSGSKGRRTDDAVIPGIGDLQLICKPHDTEIVLYTSQRGYETQMWLQKYEVKNQHNVVAIKEPRIYRWANADDDGDGGTGFYAHEGLNQRGDVENFEQGYANGIISQRSSRSTKGPKATGSQLRPVTTFELTWYWNGFDHATKYQSCKLDLHVTTRLDTRMSLTWHGDAHAAGNEHRTWAVPGIGTLALSCPTAAHGGHPTFTVTPTQADGAELYIETVTGEGPVEDHRVVTEPALDPDTGAFPPQPLPTNGVIRMKMTNDGTDRWALISAISKLNDAAHPQLNLCEDAVGLYDATFS